MQSVTKQNIISTAVQKYLNSLFELSALRKCSEPLDPYLKILRPNPSQTAMPPAELDEAAKSLRRPYLWQPLWRFDSTRIISKLFGNLDLDLQNLINSYSSAISLAYGVQIYQNSFNNVTSGRVCRPNRNDQEIPNTFHDYMLSFFTQLRDSESMLQGEVIHPNRVDWDILQMGSGPKAKTSSKKFHPNSYYSLLTLVEKTISSLCSNASLQDYGSSRPNDRKWAEGKSLLWPSAVFFTLSDVSQASTRSYSMSGQRNPGMSLSSCLRNKEGLYLALNIGHSSDRYSYGAELAEQDPSIKDLIDTGVFGATDSASRTSFPYANILICRVTNTIRQHMLDDDGRNTYGGRSDVPTQDSISCDFKGGDAITATMDLKAKDLTQQITVPAIMQSDSSTRRNDLDLTIGPVVHIAHPESFKDFVVCERPFEPKESGKFPRRKSPTNYQEWLRLSIENNQLFDLNAFTDMPTIEPNSSKLRKLTSGSRPSLVQPKNSNKVTRTCSFPDYALDRLVDNPLFGWVCYNRPLENAQAVSQAYDPSSRPTTWTSFGRPIPGPVPRTDLIGMLTTTRITSKSQRGLAKANMQHWAWTNFSSINPELYNTKNIKPSLMDYATSTDVEDRGNGKIYVDHDDVGHCPITGEALMVSTFLVGCSPDAITTSYRSSNRSVGWLIKT